MRFYLPPSIGKQIIDRFGSHRKAAKALGRSYYVWRQSGFKFERGCQRALRKIELAIANVAGTHHSEGPQSLKQREES